ncbi:SMI1/KNR4 family protein [Collimonas sp. NPDC087041]|uniref:SMI1/KNR4 family protein n=1 Tax=Collimonas sp. NPDC087041 TaxID=3363960 RepID=UPI00380C3B89
MFESFFKAFPREGEHSAPIDAASLADRVQAELGCPVPEELKKFWEVSGSGYFGDRVLYFFGEAGKDSPRDSLLDWNKKDFWRSVYPSPKDGGPIFFAETCFGDQLGFRREKGGKLIYVLFSVDTFDAFSVARGEGRLFSEVLNNQYALLDEPRYDAVRSALGLLPAGMHYAPILSPMLGGSGSADNFGTETPNVHFRTAIATFLAKRVAPSASN